MEMFFFFFERSKSKDCFLPKKNIILNQIDSNFCEEEYLIIVL